MKKLFLCLISFLVIFNLSVDVSANTASDDSYNKIKNYYANKTTIDNPDEVIAVASLGINLNSKFITDFTTSDFKSMKFSDLSKVIIALSLQGKDITNINNQNLATLLESYVQSDGSIVKDGYKATDNIEVYVLNALFVINSDKTSAVADHLASQIDTNGAFGYGYGSSGDVTSWVIETLSLVDANKYQDVINKGIAYIKSIQKSDGSFDLYGYGSDCNTQAVMIEGLSVADKANIETSYGDILAQLTIFQNANGSFGYQDTNYNAMATIQAGQALGTLYNGSVYLKARNTLSNTLLNKKQETPLNKQENNKVSNEQQKSISSSVNAMDNSNAIYYCTLLMFSMVFLISRRGKFEKDC